jgi:pyruvate,water dikinase
MTTDAPYVRFFDEGGEATIELLGGKCASLVSMTGAGMPVPPGFAVTTAAYDAFVDETGIRDEISHKLATLDPDHVSSVDAVSATIRDHLTSRPVPERVRTAVVEAYESLQARFDAPVPLAVRSSATAEDLPGASFAGQQDTYLWVVGLDSVLHHVRECWASLYTSRAILYRLKNDIPDLGLSMAVAVQKMVNSSASGVAITMNPTTGDRSKITIDASYGVGEMVVSGQVTPDNILLDKVMLSIVSETIGDKHAELVPDAAVGDLVERPVEPERRLRRCLTDAEVVAVATMAKRAEKHYGCPQDIEWAFDSDLPPGEGLLLLQSRPETVHSPGTTAAPTGTPVTPTSGLLSGITASLTNRNPS